MNGYAGNESDLIRECLLKWKSFRLPVVAPSEWLLLPFTISLLMILFCWLLLPLPLLVLLLSLLLSSAFCNWLPTIKKTHFTVNLHLDCAKCHTISTKFYIPTLRLRSKAGNASYKIRKNLYAAHYSARIDVCCISAHFICLLREHFILLCLTFDLLAAARSSAKRAGGEASQPYKVALDLFVGRAY